VTNLESDYCSVAEAAVLLRVSRSTIRRWVAAGRLAAIRVSPHLTRISRTDLQVLLTPSLAVDPGAPAADGFLAAIVESSEDAIISETLDGIITTWNHGAERLYGYTAPESIGQPRSIIIPPDRADEYRSMRERLRQGEPIAPYETVRQRKDGQRVDVWISMSPIRNDRGEIIGAAGIGRDISERKRAEREQARLAAIVASSIDAIIGNDLGGIVTDWNAAAERLYGYTAAEMVGQSIVRLIPPDRPDELPDSVNERLQRGERIEQLETVRLRKDGTTVNVSLSISPVRDGRGAIIGASTIARDISERLALQRLQDEFLALAAHELRAPLTAISGYAQILLRRGAYSEDSAAAIVRQCERLDRLIGDLIDVARLTSGQLTLRIEPVDLVELAQSCLEQARVTSGAAPPLRIVAPDHPLVGAWDRDRLGQVLDNLLSNAIKYSPGHGEVLLRVEDLGTAARVSVEDRGLGIPPEALPRIFERFYRARSADTARVDGLGLGLYVARIVVEAHGGQIRAESAGPGQGSTFTFTLPYAPPG
jgi:PAS domain S-box-containing protein/excisionase family DNA binding protein